MNQEIFLALAPQELDGMIQMIRKFPHEQVDGLLQKIVAQANAADMQKLHHQAHHRELVPPTPADTASVDGTGQSSGGATL